MQNSPNVFCYICGCYTLPKLWNEIIDFVKKANLTYFGIKLGGQDKTWVQHIACETYWNTETDSFKYLSKNFLALSSGIDANTMLNK